MAIKYLKEQETKEIINQGGLTVVNVFATWCGPCKMFAPILEEISSEVEVIKIDVDQDKDFAKSLGVQGIPATFIYKDGKLANSFQGYLPKEALDSALAPFK